MRDLKELFERELAAHPRYATYAKALRILRGDDPATSHLSNGQRCAGAYSILWPSDEKRPTIEDVTEVDLRREVESALRAARIDEAKCVLLAVALHVRGRVSRAFDVEIIEDMDAAREAFDGHVEKLREHAGQWKAIAELLGAAGYVESADFPIRMPRSVTLT